MNDTAPTDSFSSRSWSHRKWHREAVTLVGDVLPVCDFVSVLLAAQLAALAFTAWLAPGMPAGAFFASVGDVALAAAIMAPLLLCERDFLARAGSGHAAATARRYLLRFLLFGGLFLLVGVIGGLLAGIPQAWLLLWAAAALLMTAAMRVALLAGMRRLERRGVLSEAVAVVGAGPEADALIEQLRGLRHGRVDLLGVFDDRAGQERGGATPPQGSLSDLLALGAERSIDWILIPEGALSESEQSRAIWRLRALAAPVGLWSPGDVITAAPASALRSMLGASTRRLHPVAPGILARLRARLGGRTRRAGGGASTDLKLTLDACTERDFAAIAARFGQEAFGYVVTPNADHLQRLHRDAAFRAAYADAGYVLLDSRFLAHCLRLARGLRLPVCTGSDLTATLFNEVIADDDRIVLIGGSAEQAASLRSQYGLTRLAHLDPPMGLLHDPQAMAACVGFVEANSPFRFCLLAVGAPQQELLAQQLAARGVARGMALCIGASINFLTGVERRAPRWMQRAGLEWLYRLLQAPRRMAGRYLLRGPRVFALLRRTEVVVRMPQSPPALIPPLTPTTTSTRGLRPIRWAGGLGSLRAGRRRHAARAASAARHQDPQS